MEIRSIAFDWNQVRAFIATVETGSLSAAARLLGLAQPTLGRQVAGLGRDPGLVPSERVGRGMSLAQWGGGVRVRGGTANNTVGPRRARTGASAEAPT